MSGQSGYHHYILIRPYDCLIQGDFVLWMDYSVNTQLVATTPIGYNVMVKLSEETLSLTTK